MAKFYGQSVKEELFAALLALQESQRSGKLKIRQGESWFQSPLESKG